jgi:hypothetical protein
MEGTPPAGSMMAKGRRRVSFHGCAVSGCTSPAEGECNRIDEGSKEKRRKF